MHLDDATLPGWLAVQGIAGLEGPLQVETAGEGNINYVRRVRSADGASVVVKHARPALERFPEYRVTTDRLRFEWRYGEVVRERAPEVADLLPRVLLFEPDLPAIVMEDLGAAPHLERVLLDGEPADGALRALGGFLGRVHAATAPVAQQLAARFGNDAMRSLHGEHIFTLPFEPNDFPLEAAVGAEAERRLDAAARARIAELRERYYQSAAALVHGDVQGTNVILQGERPRLLDAEIAHVGDPAFDLGIALAHVEVHGAAQPVRAAQARANARALIQGYREGGGSSAVAARAPGFAGVELLRRTLGAARFGFLEGPEAACAVVRRGVELLG